jgi:hypothetical protein
MVDNSRGAVMNVSSVKRLIRLLAATGYNELQLYTEDTYEVEREPYMGYLRGRYSRAELRELDAYARLFGIELVPCIQTLAHLRSLYRWKDYYAGAFDCNDVLLTDGGRTYELIENMFRACAAAFTSREINIGMDEARMLGRGKYLDKNGYTDRKVLYKRHFDRVRGIAVKYGFRVRLWADMFLDEPPEERLDASLICWDYGNPYAEYRQQLRPGRIAKTLERAKSLCREAVFCGGAAKWYGFTPNNAYSLPLNRAALDDCEAAGVRSVMLSAWGDCGSETPVFAVFPNLVYYAERAYGNRVYGRFTENFSRRFCAFDAFMTIDCAGNLSGGRDEGFLNTSSKYLLYNDTFLGCMDKTVKPGFARIYRAHAADLRAAKRKCRGYAYLFETQIRLAEALEKKFDLGVRTRAAYRAGDKAAALRLAAEDYPAAARRIERFFAAFKKQWFTDNKPHGIDVQEIRIGALLFRLRENAKRLAAYASGKIERIPELEEEILDEFGDGNRIVMQNWGETVTPNTLIEYMPYV